MSSSWVRDGYHRATPNLVALPHAQESQHGGHREDKDSEEHEDAVGLGRLAPRFHCVGIVFFEPVPAPIASAAAIEDVIGYELSSVLHSCVTITIHTRDLES
jgi:hypothetical protein